MMTVQNKLARILSIAHIDVQMRVSGRGNSTGQSVPVPDDLRNNDYLNDLNKVNCN